MASGTKQHFGLTVLSSNKTEDGFTADFDNTKRKGGITAAGVAAMNGKIGNKALFNSYEEDNNRNPLGEVDVRGLPPPKMAVKVVDVYADGFISKDQGVGLFVDLGVDALKLESKLVNLGVGARCDTAALEHLTGADTCCYMIVVHSKQTSGRCDTGFNVGRQGGRICFLGCGGEVIFGPKPAPVEKKKTALEILTCARKKEPDSTELAAKAKEAEKTNRFGNVIFRGFTVQWWYASSMPAQPDTQPSHMRCALGFQCAMADDPRLAWQVLQAKGDASGSRLRSVKGRAGVRGSRCCGGGEGRITNTADEFSTRGWARQVSGV